MITDESVERVREAADIVAIVGEYVDLKKAGADFRGPCPFHHGTHRNFSVSSRKNFYHCFVCHESGDVFDFVRKHLGLDWPSAVLLIAEKRGHFQLLKEIAEDFDVTVISLEEVSRRSYRRSTSLTS